MTETTGLYGTPPASLAEPAADAIQFSPLIPGSDKLDDRPEASLAAMTILAPPGTVERRYVVALALRAVSSGGTLTVLAPRDRGGSRLKKELEAFGCGVGETARHHHRICTCERPEAPQGLAEAIAEGEPQRVAALGLWSQPGIFSWDRLDPGSALLLDHLGPLAGRGADFGCGIGVLARAALTSSKVEAMMLADVDRRAVEAARSNIDDARVSFHWADLRHPVAGLSGLDFVLMNPPFHDAGAEDRSLGQTMIRRAADALRKGGTLWLVANRHLPYEAELRTRFRSIRSVAETSGFKVYEATL
ncbi:class I SAM-dependent methyltransferase [Consotaella aegiceratis]|uniref:class I SAM-dependent methyltransferase n=1 Tax=Consotaella aegiceratis TaxID=3097961 RepID=UPI002F40CB6C